MNTSLTFALRIAAILLLLAVVFQFITADQLLVKTLVVAHILFILSIFSDKHERRISIVTIGLSIVVPIGAWRMIEQETSSIELFVFNLVIFLYLAFISLNTLKKTF